jgi:hypothetical protein
MHTDFRTDQLDTASLIFFNEQLKHIRPELQKIEYPELKGRGLVPVDNSTPAGARSVATRSVDYVSQVVPSSSYSTEAPRVDVTTEEYEIFFRGMQVSYGWSIDEIRSAAYARLPLAMWKAQAAREAIERKIDDIIFNGWSETGLAMQGLLAVTSPTTYTVTAGLGGTRWEVKTSDEILLDMNGAAWKSHLDTRQIETPDTMLLPPEKYAIVSQRRMGDGSDVSILDHFLRSNPFIRRVEHSWRCTTAASGDTRMVCYKNDPSRIRFMMSLEFSQRPPQERGFEIVTNCEAKTAGLDVLRNKSVTYADGI